MNNLKLEDVCDLIVDCKNRTPPEAPPGEGVAFAIGTPHIIDGRISLNLARPVTEKTFSTWTSRAIPQANDIILTREAPVGRVARIEDGMRVCLGQRTMLIRANTNKVNYRYLEFLLKNREIQTTLNAYASGSTVPHLRVAQVRELQLPRLPSIQEQQDIATTLGALDDKIAVNERTSHLAEELLRSIHTSFEKNAGAQEISSIAENVRLPYKPDSSDLTTPYIGLEHMPRKSIWLTEWETSNKVTSTKSWFQKGDVLFGKLRPYFHKVGLAHLKGICSTDILVIRAKHERYRPWLLMTLSSDEVVSHATTRSEGTRMPRAKWSDIASFGTAIPTEEEANRFREVAEPLIKRVEESVTESRILAELRDTLLPQLMSGKLRVKDAEKIVEDNV